MESLIRIWNVWYLVPIHTCQPQGTKPNIEMSQPNIYIIIFQRHLICKIKKKKKRLETFYSILCLDFNAIKTPCNKLSISFFLCKSLHICLAFQLAVGRVCSNWIKRLWCAVQKEAPWVRVDLGRQENASQRQETRKHGHGMEDVEDWGLNSVVSLYTSW